jgi:hypothetical protein
MLSNKDGGTISIGPYGSFTNRNGATVNNNGGTITLLKTYAANYGVERFGNKYATITNNGGVINLVGDDLFENYDGATLDNGGGILNIEQSAVFDNGRASAYFGAAATGTIDNADGGAINIKESGFLSNLDGAIKNDGGTVNNDGGTCEGCEGLGTCEGFCG